MLKWLKKLGCIILSIGIIAVSVNMFLAPHSIAAGWITGLAIIFETMLGFERYITILVANVVILVSALIFLGKEVFLNTLIGAALLPVFIRFVPEINLVDNTMLAMVAGSALFGVAVAILYANRASSGGTSVPPLIFKKYFRLNTSIGLFISDGIIIALNLVVFTVDSFFYAIFSVLITAITMGYIESGINKKKMVYIISDENELIKNDILKKINRGVTLVPVIGAYANTERQMLMVTLDSRNYRDLLSLIKEHDEYAFMVTNTVTDVYGQGFTYESGTV